MSIGFPFQPAIGPQAGPSVVTQPIANPNADPHLGNTYIKGTIHYDAVLYGNNNGSNDPGTVFNGTDGEKFFQDERRCKSEFLCSLKKAGEFSDKREFHIAGVGLTARFANPNLYELLHHLLFSYQIQDDMVRFRVWASHLGGGGGPTGSNFNAGAFVINWGDPSHVNGVYWLSEEEPIPVQRQFTFLGRFQANLAGGAVQPATTLNADPNFKLLRLFIVGREVGDMIGR